MCFHYSAFSQTEDQTYDTVKKDILCRAIQFLLNENNPNKNNGESLNCQNLVNLENSIPPNAESALSLFDAFRDKKYSSYGKGKLEQRLNKLISDISVELKKKKPNDPVWNESIKVLLIELNTIRDEKISTVKTNNLNSQQNPEDNPTSSLESDTDNDSENQEGSKQNNSISSMIVYFILLIMLAGIGFLVYQNQQIKKQISESEEEWQEKYSRLDNRIDTMTPVKDYKSMILKINYMNDQVTAMMQEIIVLQQRNEYKMTPEELFAKRTEHLETYTYNPNIQIYYARLQGNYFVNYEFKTEPNKEYIFKIEIDLEDTNQAVFKVVDRSEYHHWAIENDISMLRPICDYTHKLNNAYKIINLDSGLLEKKDNIWVVVKKAKITFE